MLAMSMSLGLALLVRATPVHAADGPPGVEFGARIGVGLPLGNVRAGHGDELSETVSTLVPIGLDLGVRITQRWYVGASFAFAPGILGGGLSSYCAAESYGITCSVRDMHLGATVQYRALPDSRFDPWFGAGFAYEWLTIGSTNGKSFSSEATASGWEFVSVQSGLDMKLVGALRAGPFVSVSIGQFDGDASSNPFAGGSFSHKALHEWIVLGIMVTYDLWLR
jgi:hypothetical protein